MLLVSGMASDTGQVAPLSRPMASMPSSPRVRHQWDSEVTAAHSVRAVTRVVSGDSRAAGEPMSSQAGNSEWSPMDSVGSRDTLVISLQPWKEARVEPVAVSTASRVSPR